MQVPPSVRVDKLEPGHEIIYASQCSMGTGITLAVFAVLYLILGIAELCIPWFPTAGAILFLPFVIGLAAIFGILAGKHKKISFIRGVLISGTINAVILGLCVAFMIGRMIAILLIIPLTESEGPNAYYYWDHVYFDNGTIAEYDDDPLIVPRDKLSDGIDFTATGIIFAVEMFLLFPAFVVAIVEACCACRTTCCGTKVRPKVMIQQPDGTLAEATVMYTNQPMAAQPDQPPAYE